MAGVKAVVLARGLATRMREADTGASLLPVQARAAAAGLKAMMPVGGTQHGGVAQTPRPFLDYVLSALADAGYRDIGLVIGPEHDEIRARYDREVVPERVRVTWIVQPEPRGTADAVLACEPWVGDTPFIVVNGDNLYPVSALQALRELGQPGLAAFARESLTRDGVLALERVAAFAILRTGAHDQLSAIVEKPDAGAIAAAGPQAMVSVNCWRFDARVFPACRDVPRSPRGEFELPAAVELAMARGMSFLVVRAQGEVLDLSRRADVLDVSRRLFGREPRP